MLGGTFDPVHVGHVVLACEARYQVGLDRVMLVVAGDPWQKRGQVVAPATERLAMVRAAVEGIAGLEASDLELHRAGPTYTADTLQALAGADRELFLVMGADVAASLDTWERMERVRELTTLVVAGRPGATAPELPGWRVVRIDVPDLRISSTELRDRLAEGRPVDGLVPPGAVRVIREHGLYTRR